MSKSMSYRSAQWIGFSAGLVALSLVTACSNRSEKSVQTETNMTVIEPAATPGDLAQDSNASVSSTTTGVDSGMAAGTTDAMSGAASSNTASSDHKIVPKRYAKAKRMKSTKHIKTETKTTETRSADVGATAPADDTSSGASSSAGTGEAAPAISAPILVDPSVAPGRMASALTDWGVVYTFNNAAAAR